MRETLAEDSAACAFHLMAGRPRSRAMIEDALEEDLVWDCHQLRESATCQL